MCLHTVDVARAVRWPDLDAGTGPAPREVAHSTCKQASSLGQRSVFAGLLGTFHRLLDRAPVLARGRGSSHRLWARPESAVAESDAPLRGWKDAPTAQPTRPRAPAGRAPDWARVAMQVSSLPSTCSKACSRVVAVPVPSVSLL